MKKILIWGTGQVSSQLQKGGLSGEIIGFIESCRQRKEHHGLPVYGIDEIPQAYDYIIVANTYVNEIYQLCAARQIPMEKMLFLFPIKKEVGISDQKSIREILGEENYTNYCANRGVWKDTFFEKDFVQYNQWNRRKNFEAKEEKFWPVIADKFGKAGTINNYFLQDLWAAKLIHKAGVKEHFDIGSRIDGFIAHLLAMEIAVTVIDIREFPGTVENLFTIVDDATLLKNIPDESIKSISALCSLEHFGLGRYGDPVDPEACFKCFEKIQKKIKKDGDFYLSVPVGRERVEFNAHRIFYASTIVDCFSQMQLIEFSCAANGQVEYNVPIEKYDNDPHNGEYRYGLFHFKKLENCIL